LGVRCDREYEDAHRCAGLNAKDAKERREGRHGVIASGSLR